MLYIDYQALTALKQLKKIDLNESPPNKRCLIYQQISKID